MTPSKHITSYFVVGGFLLIAVFFLNINLGSLSIPFKSTFQSLTGQSIDENWRYIINQYRLPKALTAIIVGSGLGLSGLLMQSLFRNPLAGPYILGISSGASLGVSLVIMGSGLFSSILAGFFISKWSIIIAASLGSFLVLLAVLAVSARIKNTMAILIVGLMFSSLTGAVVNVLSYFTDSEDLQRYVFWSFGSLGDLSWTEIEILGACWLAGILLSIFCLKPLNALLLGENYAKSLGTSLKINRILIIIATTLLAGGITAFAGPIAFIGLAVPHVVRLIIPHSNHLILMPAVMLMGAAVMLICDTLAQVPGSEMTLPINAVTSIFGAPVVIWLLIRKKKLVF